MYVLFTVGADQEFEAFDGKIRTEWYSENVFVRICEYTDHEMREAWNLVENATRLEVVTFEVISDREYDERLVDAAAQVASWGDGYELRYLFPKTIYPVAA